MRRVFLLALVCLTLGFQFKCVFDGVVPMEGQGLASKVVGLWVYIKPTTGQTEYVLDSLGQGAYREDGGPWVGFTFTVDEATFEVNTTGALVDRFKYDYATDSLTVTAANATGAGNAVGDVYTRN